MGTPPYKALRAAYRHRLYAVGMFTWMLTLGLVVAGFQWNPNKPPVQKFVPAKVSAHTTEPQVAGAVTVKPTEPSSEADGQGLHVVSGTSPELVMPTRDNPDPGQSSNKTPSIVLPTEQNPNPGQTPTVPVVVPPPSDPNPGPTPPPTNPGPVEPTPPVEPPVTPPTDPTPPPPPPTGPTLNPACAVDPLLNFALSTPTSVTVPVGGQTAPQSVTTSDNSQVIWQPGGPIVWGDGTSTDAASPVSMVLTYNPGTVTGSGVGFFVRALETAVPGATYTVSWHAEDGTRGICHTVNVQVTVEAAAPPPPATP